MTPEELAQLLGDSLTAEPAPPGDMTLTGATPWWVASFVLTSEQAAVVAAAVAGMRDRLGGAASDGDALVELVKGGTVNTLHPGSKD